MRCSERRSGISTRAKSATNARRRLWISNGRSMPKLNQQRKIDAGVLGFSRGTNQAREKVRVGCRGWEREREGRRGFNLSFGFRLGVGFQIRNPPNCINRIGQCGLQWLKRPTSFVRVASPFPLGHRPHLPPWAHKRAPFPNFKTLQQNIVIIETNGCK